uniref:Uncharacterized protein n=1 Tax=Tetranychus urticae TaxID=32264 RepID=T1KP44_TETUR
MYDYFSTNVYSILLKAQKLCFFGVLVEYAKESSLSPLYALHQCAHHIFIPYYSFIIVS